MRKLLSCREIGCECDYIVTGETEEEVFEVLITEDESTLRKNPLNRTCVGETLNEQRIHAAEELITGDSDDPPLSEEDVSKLLSQNSCEENITQKV